MECALNNHQDSANKQGTPEVNEIFKLFSLNCTQSYSDFINVCKISGNNKMKGASKLLDCFYQLGDSSRSKAF